MTKPIIGSFLVISFLGAWNQYVWPRFATDRNDWQTVQIALRTIGTERPDRAQPGLRRRRSSPRSRCWSC